MVITTRRLNLCQRRGLAFGDGKRVEKEEGRRSTGEEGTHEETQTNSESSEPRERGRAPFSKRRGRRGQKQKQTWIFRLFQ